MSQTLDSPPRQDIQISDDAGFHRRNWIAERIGWAAMGVVLVAAAIGLLGPGPLSSTSAGDPSGLIVEYQRFGRWQAPQTLVLRAAPSLATGGEVTFSLDRAYLEQHEVHAITPTPLREVHDQDRVSFVFAVSGDDASAATFHLTPQRFGRKRCDVRAGEAPPIHVRQFVYP